MKTEVTRKSSTPHARVANQQQTGQLSDYADEFNMDVTKALIYGHARLKVKKKKLTVSTELSFIT